MASATKTVQKHYKKFCSYCKAKGLPESAFTSHFVKDKPGKGGKVCCPELLKNECGYCHEIGHTPRFCPKLKARDARRKAAAKRAKAPRAKPVARNANGAAPTKVTNLFEALAGYSTPEKPKEAFPALTRAPKKAPAAPQGVWGGANTLSIAELEKLLAAKRAAVDPAPFAAEHAAAQAIADEARSAAARAEAPQLSNAEQAFIAAQLEKQSQSLEETADGEAFFDNVADAEEAVEALAAPEKPVHARAGTSRTPERAVSAPLPETAHGIALPPCCNLAADFGAEPSGDGWGSDCDE